MQVTSDTLFHFTTSLRNLENILLKKFRLTYCKEEYLLDYETHDSYYPMVSFCDIPLSLAKKQIERYGSYAIGMTKEWGTDNNLNPVVYIEKNSLLAKDIQATLDNIVKMTKSISTQIEKTKTSAISKTKISTDKALEHIKDLNPENEKSAIKELHALTENLQNALDSIKNFSESFNNLKNIVNNFGNIFRYIKNYEGALTRNYKTTSKYRFYDEREWRYVPALDDNRVKRSLNAIQYREQRGLSKNKPFIENINLSFTSNDIKYLIVKSNKDIPKLIKIIKSIDNLTKSPNEADVLTTKILTSDQLNNDF